MQLERRDAGFVVIPETDAEQVELEAMALTRAVSLQPGPAFLSASHSAAWCPSPPMAPSE
jgi:hypothetical protein